MLSKEPLTCSLIGVLHGILRIPCKRTCAMVSLSCTNLRGEMILCRHLDTNNSAATQQKAPQKSQAKHDRNRLSAHWTPMTIEGFPPQQNFGFPGLGPDGNLIPGTPLSQIRGFPDATSPAQAAGSTIDIVRQPSPLLMPQPFQAPEVLSMSGDGFNGPETLALPQVSSALAMTLCSLTSALLITVLGQHVWYQNGRSGSISGLTDVDRSRNEGRSRCSNIHYNVIFVH